MAKKIKKQIKRSLPYFMIFSLIISSAVVGLVFNFDVKVKNLVNDFSLEISKPEASAQNDTASTTVTVQNAAPTWAVQTTENTSSTSTSPVNIGNGISFTATANDIEGNDYYLIVCDSPGVSPGAGGAAPTCTGGGLGTLCVSGATVETNPATCTNTVADPSAEFNDWYSYVCDDHATEADCSVLGATSGFQTADNESPFYVNHASVLTAVNTTIDNQDPGGTFQMTATVTDGDTAGGADEISLYICSSNSWATSTGCADMEFCTGTSTSPNVSCSFATTTPAVDGSYAYYAFVKDWHAMPATGNSQTNNYNVNNVAPTVSAITLNDDNPLTLNMRFVSNVVASTSATVTDDNACTDLASATSSIYLSTVAGAENCSSDDDNCYQITAVNCTQDAGSCTGSGDLNATYSCLTSVEFHATPTDNSANNPEEANNWRAGFTIIDDDGASGVATTTNLEGVEVNTLVALTITELAIPYGSIKSGQSTGDYNATTTIVNYGNSPLNSDINGTDMTGAGTIAITYQKYDLVAQNYTTLGNVASTTLQNLDIVSSKPTTSSVNVEDEVYWGISIPAVVSGDYSGTNTFIATLDNLDW